MKCALAHLESPFFACAHIIVIIKHSVYKKNKKMSRFYLENILWHKHEKELVHEIYHTACLYAELKVTHMPCTTHIINPINNQKNMHNYFFAVRYVTL